MSEIAEQIAALSRLVHEPARLAILTALSACRRADFVFLQRLTGLTGGNLSAHLAKLEEAKLVEIEKRFLNKKPNTLVSLTPVGQETVERHWSHLERLRVQAVNVDGNESGACQPNNEPANFQL